MVILHILPPVSLSSVTMALKLRAFKYSIRRDDGGEMNGLVGPGLTEISM